MKNKAILLARNKRNSWADTHSAVPGPGCWFDSGRGRRLKTLSYPGESMFFLHSIAPFHMVFHNSGIHAVGLPYLTFISSHNTKIISINLKVDVLVRNDILRSNVEEISVHFSHHLKKKDLFLLPFQLSIEIFELPVKARHDKRTSWWFHFSNFPISAISFMYAHCSSVIAWNAWGDFPFSWRNLKVQRFCNVKNKVPQSLTFPFFHLSNCRRHSPSWYQGKSQFHLMFE